MLNQINSTPQKQQAETPVQMLLDCHKRIRHFLALAQQLATASNAPVSQLAEAARDIHRYFSISLPLHEQDENLSLHARLRTSATNDKDAEDSSNAMVIQHQTIDDVVARLLPMWERVSNDPVALGSFAQQITALTTRLAELMDGHLKLEEEQVFPAIDRCLSPEDRAQMVTEMRARRA
ncbi:MAG TPA: hemerythrin domain-containing protein [Candidatus Acidoferrales bacterium]|nr:hemerythrin domain-containing protein [Candidatus Acidoferrales bacterium]